MRKERETQDRVIRLFKNQLHYEYLGNLEEFENTNIRTEDVEKWLNNRGISEQSIKKVLFDLQKKASLNSQDDLYTINKEFYSVLRYGLNIRDDQNDKNITIHLIDWKNPLNNHFAIAEEVTVKGENTKRPDIVLYVNGIAIGVLELKRGGISVTEGIRQNLDNQNHRFIKPFFSTIQVVLAGNDTQGLYYGTIKTPEKFFLKWKEDHYTYSLEQNLLDQHLLQFCEKARLLELIHDFIVFDSGIKKLCRPNQYFGIKAAQEYIKRREGGIIWHTQGSGKSLTMVWLAKWIRENVENARLLIITDRLELDHQIEKVFTNTNENIKRVRRGSELLSVLNNTQPWLICSIVHLFGNRTTDDEEMGEFIQDLKKPADFSPKGNLIVFIDECHRTQSGDLHKAMKDLLPDALLIGFTGTPLLKQDKKSIEVFGPYIHTYKFNEAVQDGVVLDLLYEARDIDQKITNPKAVDEWFDIATQGMNDLPKAELKQLWGTMQKILSSKQRLEVVAFDIIKDFRIKPRLKDGKGNAMLVARSIYEACRYYSIFQSPGFKDCAIITSFVPTVDSIKGESTGAGDTEKWEQYEVYQAMLNGQDRAKFEENAKKMFIEQPANMQLLIVVDKLLTGFDAPSCTYLYIDKEMQDHGLFQAICRVNRTENDDKQFGYIVDYKNLFDSLNKSITDYTSNAFDGYDQDDVKGLLVDRLKKAKESLDDALETVYEITKHVESPKQIEQYMKYFVGNTEDKDALKENEEKRLNFYLSVVALIRAYNNVASEMEEAGYSKQEAIDIKNKVNNYTELRNAIKNASGDYIDLKQHEPDMRRLLDMYISADSSRIISDFKDASLLELIVEKGIIEATKELPDIIKKSKEAVAESVEANIRKVIIQEMPINPKFYERMSTLLHDLIVQRKNDAIAYEEYLKEIEQLARQLKPENRKNAYPASIDTEPKQALFDLIRDEAKVLALESDIYNSMEEQWIGNTIKERKVRYAIKSHIEDPEQVETILEIVKNQREYKE
jgi:type I restriction enzyme R subunit